MSNIFLNQVLRIELVVKDQDGAVVDVSGASEILFVFRKPSGASVSVNPSFITDGIDGALYYITDGDDVAALDEVGNWALQCVIVDGTDESPTTITSIPVKRRV